MTPQEDLYKCRKTCRVCGGASLEEIIRFPDIPIADSLLEKWQIDQAEIKVPLTFVLCTHCFHAQILEDVRPEILFNKNYPYYTGVSPSLSGHFTSSARDLISRYELDTSKRVIEIASNDGTMLQVFNDFGCAALGIDPATGPCTVATSKGLNVINAFFTSALADQIAVDFGKADLILGNNVLAHVPGPGDLVKGITMLLAPEGQVVIEVPYLLSLLNHVEFDTIFHQHYSYFSIHSAEGLFVKYGLYINDVEKLAIHGGSIRLFFSWHEGKSDRLTDLIKQEVSAGVKETRIYRDFATKVIQVIADLKRTILELKKAGKTIAGYGAAGKANTLVNVCGIGTDELGYIADLSIYKQGKYFTGQHFLIVPPAQILEDMPDYLLILAWNFKDEIMKQLSGYQAKGGHFIIPIPAVKII